MDQKDLFLFNGIHRRTGQPLAWPFASRSRLIGTKYLPPGMNREDLRQTGWAFVLAKGDPAKEQILRRLAPLVDKRTEDSQGGVLYFDYIEGTTATDFKRMNKALYNRIGRSTLPYYLMLVGSPERIPFSFQFDLSSSHAVGRLHFENLDLYSSYVESLLRSEGAGGPPRRAVFWSADHPGDDSSLVCTETLTRPLVKEISRTNERFAIENHFSGAASKNVLGGILDGTNAPAFLFTSGHGLFFSTGDQDQRAEQGALVCGNWEGPSSGAPARDKYFAAEDLGNADLSGLISFHFACNSAGTPQLDSFYFRTDAEKRREMAPRPFVSNLAQAMLGNPRGGSLAFIGHVERTWLNTFLWRRNEDKPYQYSDVIGEILRGARVGGALEIFSKISAEISQTVMSEILENAGPYDPKVKAVEELGQISDLRGFVILGDPAVRLSAAGSKPSRENT